jgi:hypothetical protein
MIVEYFESFGLHMARLSAEYPPQSGYGILPMNSGEYLTLGIDIRMSV